MFNLPVGLGTLIASTPALNPAAGGSFLPITTPEAAMAGLIVVVPVAILFLFFQRFLVRGILVGLVQGLIRVLSKSNGNHSMKIIAVDVILVDEPAYAPAFNWRDGLPGSEPASTCRLAGHHHR